MRSSAVALVSLLVATTLAGCFGGGGGGDEEAAPDPEPIEAVLQLPFLLDGCQMQSQRGGPVGGVATKDPAGSLFGVGYATSPERTLLRWYWNDAGWREASYAVERQVGDQWALVDTVMPLAAAPAAASAMDGVDDRWPDLSGELVDRVQEIGVEGGFEEAWAFVLSQGWYSAMLADQRYPVALALGWGVLVEPPGAQETYRVVATVAGESSVLGTVDVQPGGDTPLPAPTGLDCLDLNPATSNTLRQDDADWAEKQANRRFDHRILLAWDLPEAMDQDDDDDPDGTWGAGYDVYRNPVGEDPVRLIQDDLDLPVLPVPAAVPERLAGDGQYTDEDSIVAYESVDHYVQDLVPQDGLYEYRVAQRDLLGNPADWPADQGRFSQPVTAASRDFQPPPALTGFNVTEAPDFTKVTVRWDAVDPGAVPDFSHVRLYRAWSAQAEGPGPDCLEPGACFTEVKRTAAASWTDSDTSGQPLRWYRAAAVDAYGNVGPLTAPASAYIWDIHAPDTPSELRPCTEDEVPQGQRPAPSPASPPRPVPPAAPGDPPRAPWPEPTEPPADPDPPRRPTGGSTTGGDPAGPSRPAVLIPLPGLDALRDGWRALGSLRGLGAFGGIGPAIVPAPFVLAAAPQEDDVPPGCLVIEPQDPDTSRVRLYCRFREGGDWLYMGERATAAGQKEVWDLTQIYSPAMLTPSVCRAMDFDAVGNDGAPTPEQEAQEIIWGGPGAQVPAPAKPHIRVVDHFEDGSDDGHPYTAVIQWDADETPGLSGFTVRRAVDTEDGFDWEVLGQVGPGAREFQDPDRRARSVAEYRITAHTIAGGEEESEGYHHKVVVDWGRTMANMGLTVTNEPNHNFVRWNCGVCAEMYLERPLFSVWRAPTQAGPWTQLTPAYHPQFGLPIATEIGAPRNVYMDTHGNEPGLWYQVIGHDQNTFDPIVASPAVQATGDKALDFALDWEDHALQPQGAPFLATPAGCGDVPIDQDKPLRFAGGFAADILTYNAGGDGTATGTASIPVQGGDRILGGQFQDVKVVDTDNNVCAGRLVAALSVTPIEVANPAGLAYTIHAIVAGPTQHPDGKAHADIAVELPDHWSFHRSSWETWEEHDVLPLRRALIDSELDWSFEHDAATDLGQLNCFDPDFWFQTHALPLRASPSSGFTVDPSGITMDNLCSTYADRYNGQWGPRPGWSDTLRGDSNNGLLDRNMDSLGPGTIDRHGLSVELRGSVGDHTWVTGAPAGFRIRAENTEVSINQDDIVDGRLEDGTVTLRHQMMGFPTEWNPVTEQYEPIDRNTTYQTSFSTLHVEGHGALHGTTASADFFEWLPDGGFLIGPHNGYEFYASPVVVHGAPPGQATNSILYRAPGHAATPLAGDQFQLDGELEPGLNLREEEGGFIWYNCAQDGDGPSLIYPAGVDVALRMGGLTGVLVSDADETQMRPYGFDVTFQRLALHFHNNQEFGRDMAFELVVPYPGDFEIKAVDVRLNAYGCIGQFNVPVSDQEKHLHFWDAGMEMTSGGLEPAPGYEAAATSPHRLRTHGYLDLPNLYEEDGEGQPFIVDTYWLNTGDPVETTFPDHASQHETGGFPVLIEALRWSLPSDGEAPLEPAATPKPVPVPVPDAAGDIYGYFQVIGPLVTPFFGPLGGEVPELTPDLFLFAWEPEYVGFDQMPNVLRQWVDQEDVGADFDYDELLYSFLPGEGGRFVGFESIPFRPGELPDPSQVITVENALTLLPDVAPIFTQGEGAMASAMKSLFDGEGLPDLAFQDMEGSLGQWGQQLAGDLWDDYGVDHMALLEQTWSGVRDQAGVDDVAGFIQTQIDGGLLEGIDLQSGSIDTALFAQKGLELLDVNGLAEVSPIQLGDFQVDDMTMVITVNVKAPGTGDPLLVAEDVKFTINRQGELLVEAPNIELSLAARDVTAKLTIYIRPANPSFEGGISVFNMDFEAINILHLGAVIGIGKDSPEPGAEAIYYVGAQFDGTFSPSAILGTVSVGGAFLAGSINPASPVLQAHFGQAVSKLSEAGDGVFDGFYARVYGSVPVFNYGCALRVNLAAELAVWYWNNADQDTQVTGGRISGGFSSTFLCIASIVAQVSLEYSKTIKNGVLEHERFDGEGWAAGGIGFCSPETWTNWDTRWWDDGGCAQGGAWFWVWYDSKLDTGDDKDNDGWDYDYELDGEIF
ncbi:MAG: hypothetical protein ACPGQL_07875 [Thermoplasmatota archaeon]